MSRTRHGHLGTQCVQVRMTEVNVSNSSRRSLVPLMHWCKQCSGYSLAPASQWFWVSVARLTLSLAQVEYQGPARTSPRTAPVQQTHWCTCTRTLDDLGLLLWSLDQARARSLEHGQTPSTPTRPGREPVYPISTCACTRPTASPGSRDSTCQHMRRP